MIVSVFRNFSDVVENLALPDILDQIRSDRYALQVDHLRSLLKEGNDEGYDKAKRALLAFTPSATFKSARKIDLLDQYSGIIHLDFDKIPTEKIELMFSQVTSIPETLACFHSPSGNGLKVFVRVDTRADFHTLAYRQVQDYYENQLGFQSDPKCKDLTRLCFMSYDPRLYFNPESWIMKIVTGHTSQMNNMVSPELVDYYKKFKESVAFTELKITYNPGSRNNFIYQLACNCNRHGIPENQTIDYISSEYDLKNTEIASTVGSSYKHHSAEFGKYALYSNYPPEKSYPGSKPNDPEVDYLKNSPIIPEQIYQNLPVLLMKGTDAMHDLRERDVFLTGALAVLSGCLPGVKGVYAQQTMYPNLFSFIIAPAASGKGAMKFSKMLADGYHDNTLKVSREQARMYKALEANYKARMRNKTDQEPYEDPPEKPPFKVVFIPANSSYAKLLLHLQENEGEGIICEAEADTMGNVLKHDWGNYSDMLRKVFHHDRISSSKKTNDEFIEVNNPRLSIAISGTPNQVTGLISSSEDGLFSRFLFYVFKADLEWRDVSPFNGNTNLTGHFKELSAEVFQLVEYLKESPTEVELTREQWDELNAIGKIRLKDTALFNGEETASIIKRLGVILYRLCMLFTSMRKFENGDDSAIVICTDSDFDTAKNLVEIYLQHSLLMYHNLPKKEAGSVFIAGDRKKAFIDTLPQEFKRSEAIEIGKQFNLSVRTIDKSLKELTGKCLTQIQYGCYSKL